MDILVVSGITFPEIGGVSNYVDFLTKNINNVKVLSFNFYNPYRSQVKIINGKKYYLLRRIYFNNTKISFPIRILLMSYFIRKFSKSSVIYAQDVGIGGLASLISLKRYFLRFVGDWAYESYYQHTIFSTTYEKFLFKTKKNFVMRFLSKFIFYRSIKVITPAYHLYDILRKYYHVKPSKIVVIENFVNLPKAWNKDKVIKNKYILFVGRIISLKRVDRLIKAYLLSGSKHYLYIVGDGTLKEVYSKFIHDPRIIFLSKRPKREVFSLLKNASCIILPSDYEGVPFILLEAAFFNTPIIAYKNSGNLEAGKYIKGIKYFSNVSDLSEYLKKGRFEKTMLVSLPRGGDHIKRLLKEIL